MIDINQQFITKNRSHKTLVAKGVVIHETADPGATAQEEHDYFANNTLGKSAHFFVDWNGIIQLIPLNEQAWHAGATANKNYLSIEMCHPEVFDIPKFNAVWKNTIELTSYLLRTHLKEIKVTPSNIMSHKEVSIKWGESTHVDPVSFLKDYHQTMEGFRVEVQKEINAQEQKHKEDKIINDFIAKMKAEGKMDSPEFWLSNLETPVKTKYILMLLAKMFK